MCFKSKEIQNIPKHFNNKKKVIKINIPELTEIIFDSVGWNHETNLEPPPIDGRNLGRIESSLEVSFDTINEIINALNFVLPNLLPRGMVMMWNGIIDEIPDGWALCDGQNGTPDLRNRFVVGVGDDYELGDMGGSDTHILTEEEMTNHVHTVHGHSHTAHHNHSSPAHTHGNNAHSHHAVDGGSLFSIRRSGGTDTRRGGFSQSALMLPSLVIPPGTPPPPANIGAWGEGFIGPGRSSTDTIAIHGAAATINTASVTTSTSGAGETGSVGESQAHENRPPYLALCYIMKL